MGKKQRVTRRDAFGAEPFHGQSGRTECLQDSPCIFGENAHKLASIAKNPMVAINWIIT